MDLVKRTYSPKGYSCSITVEVTEEQAIALDNIAKKDEFKAYFWAEKVKWFNNGDITDEGLRVIRINGVHKVVGDGSYVVRGCGGTEYTFILKSGEKITSDDVWIQGKIPEELKNILVDNAITDN